MQDTTTWILGIAMAALVLLGIVIAANAADGMMYYVGLGLALFGVFFTYGLVARHSGRRGEPG